MPRIAIVDDDQSHCRALARLLRAAGMDTVTFPSAEDFLASALGRTADCVVLDIQLGGMSGFDLQRRMATEGGWPPVVFLTAHGEPETIARAAERGCDYVRKIEPAEDLLAAIRGTIARRHPPAQSPGSPL